MKTAHIYRTSTKGPTMTDCYCHFQTHAVHTQSVTTSARSVGLVLLNKLLLFAYLDIESGHTVETERPVTHVCMIFLLCFDPQNVYLKHELLFPKHPVYTGFRRGSMVPKLHISGIFFSIRCLLVIIQNAKLSHELRLGSTDSTAILFETWIKPIII